MASGLLNPLPEHTGQGHTLKVPTPRPLAMRSRARRRRSSTKSASLETLSSLSSFSSQSIVSSPNIVITRRGSLSKSQPVFTFTPRVDVNARKTRTTPTTGARVKRRRIRTFYSNGLWTIDFSKKARQSHCNRAASTRHQKFPKNPVMAPCGPPSPSPLPPITPMMGHHHLSVDVLDLGFGDHVSYDSAASNVAANNDLDRRMADDEEEDEFSDLETPDLPAMAPSDAAAEDRHKRDSQFKIVVSAPDRDCSFHDQPIDALGSRMTAKEARIGFYGSDYDCNTDDCGSSEDEDESALFLSDNDCGVGVFSSFPGDEQSDSDYLSAQSEDFEDLTIRRRPDRTNRNIRFRRLEAANYLNVLGPSDLGSSDTECLSSGDSITDMMPPAAPPLKFLPMVAR